jgi:hypothetical protein
MKGFGAVACEESGAEKKNAAVAAQRTAATVVFFVSMGQA